ncbi:MAG: hypothetical protein Unbinned96contig1001_39 [Prokaryotic dsDNA virus sp.]|nr:MAG: hypothetical protein Unbinned96contig1001_39 [Prokaryotic dsDNA virus sp.]|tara:strand:+ start:469 stop:804 length:336 start_codon:yes stop_codon:yes gene_type:complete
MIKAEKFTRTTQTGVEYTLLYNGLYYWSREGSTPEALKGRYSGQYEALRGFELYDASIAPQISHIEEDVELEELTKKADLQKWADMQGVEVPPEYKQPSAIKKFLLGVFNA